MFIFGYFVFSRTLTFSFPRDILLGSHSPNGEVRERNEADMCDEAKTLDKLRNMSLVHLHFRADRESSFLGNQG